MEKFSEEVFNYFIERHVVLKEDWLQGICDFIKSQRLPVKSASQLCALVYEQWLYSDLSDSIYPSFEQADLRSDAVKTLLTSPIVVQVVSVVDIGSSFHSQLGKLTYEFVDNSGFDALPESDEHKPWEAKPSRMLMLELSDGARTMRAIEHYSITQLSLLTKPGCKMLLLPDALCRRGIFLLKSKNCQLLGGDVEELMLTGRPVEVMSRQLGTSLPDKRPVSAVLTSKGSAATSISSATPNSSSASVAATSRRNETTSISSVVSVIPTNVTLNRSLIGVGGPSGSNGLLDDDDFDTDGMQLDDDMQDDLNEGIIEEDEDDDEDIDWRDHDNLNDLVAHTSKLILPGSSTSILNQTSTASSVFSPPDPVVRHVPPIRDAAHRVSHLQISPCLPSTSSSTPTGLLSTVHPTPRATNIPIQGSPPDYDAVVRRSTNRARLATSRLSQSLSGSCSTTASSSSSPAPVDNLNMPTTRKRSSTASLLASLLDSPRQEHDTDEDLCETTPLFDPRRRPGSSPAVTPVKQPVMSDSRSRLEGNSSSSTSGSLGILRFMNRNEPASPPKKKAANVSTRTQDNTVKAVKVEVIDLSDDEEDVKPVVDRSVLPRSTNSSANQNPAVVPSVARSPQIRIDAPPTVSRSPIAEVQSSSSDSEMGPFAYHSHHTNPFQEKFVRLNVTLLEDALARTRFTIGSSRCNIQAIIKDIVEPLRIVDNMWTQKVLLLDESGESAAIVDDVTLTALIGLSAPEAIAAKRSGDSGRRADGARKFKAVECQMQRCDLLLEVEFFSGGASDPVVRKISTLAQAVGAV